MLSYLETPALLTRKTTPCLSCGSKITILTHSTGIWLYHVDCARITPYDLLLSYDARKLSSAGGPTGVTRPSVAEFHLSWMVLVAALGERSLARL